METPSSKDADSFISGYMHLRIENGICHATWFIPEIDLAAAREMAMLRLRFLNGKEFPMLADLSSLKRITKDARDYFSSDEGCRGMTACAMYSDTGMGLIIGNFFEHINRPRIPIRYFTGKEEALEWLQKLMG